MLLNCVLDIIRIMFCSIRRWKNNFSSGRHGMANHMETLRLVQDYSGDLCCEWQGLMILFSRITGTCMLYSLHEGIECFGCIVNFTSEVHTWGLLQEK